MQCPFCQANSAPNIRSCPICGGPLSGANRLIAPKPSRKVEVSPVVSPRLVEIVPALVLAPVPVPEIPRAKPLIFVRKSRENPAPRIVAAGFWQDENDFYPLLVLENGGLQVWDLQTDVLHAFPARRTLHPPGLVTAAAFSAERKVVATGHESGRMRLQWLQMGEGRVTGKCQIFAVLEAHRGSVLSLAIAKNRLYSAGSDGAVALTSLPDAPNTKSLEGSEPQLILDGLSALSCLSVSPDGRYLALGTDGGQVQMWHLAEDGKRARLDWTSQKDPSRLKTLLFAPNGNLLISRDARGDLCLWAAQSGHRLPFAAAPNSLVAPAFAPDSRLLVYADNAGGISLCDAWTGTSLRPLSLDSGAVQALCFSPIEENGARETTLLVAGAQEILVWKNLL